MNRETIAYELCGRTPLSGRTLQIVVHGGTYDRWYWDPSYRPDRYSYVQAAVAQGYAVLVVDRVGHGESSRPLSAEVTTMGSAYALHQLVQAARAGELPGQPSFETVVMVGHSVGSAVSLVEAASYRDVDGLVITGLLHVCSVGCAEAIASLWPAAFDPVIDESLDPGYATTRPGTRAVFYADDSEEALIAADEQAKDTITGSEGATFFAAGPYSAGVDVPVLLAVGSEDTLFCLPSSCEDAATVVAGEMVFYPNAACLDAFVLDGAGHNLNLHWNSEEWFAAADRWVADRVGTMATTPSKRSAPPQSERSACR